MDASLPKSERLSGLLSVTALFEHGKGISQGCLRCKYLSREDDLPARIVVSVPKRLFKRAVKRNLLKRRIRESYRNQKDLAPKGTDIMFVYTSHEIASSEEIFAAVQAILKAMQ